MKQLALTGATLAAFALSIPLSAQMPQAGGNGVGDFTIERVLTLNSIVSPNPPSFPAPVLAGIQSGTLEIHQQFIYNSATRIMEQNAFVVPGKSPLPFPSRAGAPVADHYFVQVDASNKTASPGASVALVGRVLSNDVPTPWGDITGANITLAFAYQGSGPSTSFTNVLESVSPLYNLYTPNSVGSLSLIPASQKCSVATLNGVYMFRLQGSQLVRGVYGPFADNGRFIADGKGNITLLDNGNFAGFQFFNRNLPIVYDLDDFCSGTMKLPGSSLDFQVSKDGRRVNMLFNEPVSVVGNGSATLQ